MQGTTGSQQWRGPVGGMTGRDAQRSWLLVLDRGRLHYENPLNYVHLRVVYSSECMLDFKFTLKN